MLTVTAINMLAVLFASAYKLKDNLSLKFSFFTIFIFLAIRYDYGNDYTSYLNAFLDINRDGVKGFFWQDSHFELGWILLCRLFNGLGFFAMVAALAAVNCVVYYIFVKKYVPPVCQWIAVFLYVFGPGLMLTNSSAMRQSVAINIFLFSIDYIYKKDFLKYFFSVFIAYLFHSSAIFLIFVYLIGLYNFKINKITGVLLFVIYIAIPLIGIFYLHEIYQFIFLIFKRYGVYSGAIELGTGLGLVFNSLLFIFILYYDHSFNNKFSIVNKIAILGCMFIPVTLVILMAGRIGMYFQPVLIAVYPNIIYRIKNKYLSVFLKIAILIITINAFVGFFNTEPYKIYFENFKTIFSSRIIY